MGQVLPRNLGDAYALHVGEYTVEGVDQYEDAKAILRCPKCGGVDVIGAEHVIDPAGRVTPAWRCWVETCGEVVWIELGDWPGRRV